MTTATHSPIQERSAPQRNLRVEETDQFFIVRGVRVLNEVSRNGGTYTRRARESAARLACRLPLAIEHTGDDGRRQYTDRVGQLREARLTHDGQVEADAYINRGHDRASQIRIDAEHFPENICLSIELPGDGWVGEDNRPQGGYVVEDITSMADCCIVATGGTTSNLFEDFRHSTNQSDEDDMSETKATQQVSKEALSEAVKSSLAEVEERRKVSETIDKLTRQVEDLGDANKKLQEQLDKYKLAEQRAAKAAEIRKKAKELGAGEISEAYATSLAKLDDGEIEESLKDRAELLKKAGGEPSSESRGDSTEPNFHAPSVGGEKKLSDEFSWLR